MIFYFCISSSIFSFFLYYSHYLSPFLISLLHTSIYSQLVSLSLSLSLTHTHARTHTHTHTLSNSLSLPLSFPLSLSLFYFIYIHFPLPTAALISPDLQDINISFSSTEDYLCRNINLLSLKIYIKFLSLMIVTTRRHNAYPYLSFVSFQIKAGTWSGTFPKDDYAKGPRPCQRRFFGSERVGEESSRS